MRHQVQNSTRCRALPGAELYQVQSSAAESRLFISDQWFLGEREKGSLFLQTFGWWKWLILGGVVLIWSQWLFLLLSSRWQCCQRGSQEWTRITNNTPIKSHPSLKNMTFKLISVITLSFPFQVSVSPIKCFLLFYFVCVLFCITSSLETKSEKVIPLWFVRMQISHPCIHHPCLHSGTRPF